jgi:hypothetical protein
MQVSERAADTPQIMVQPVTMSGSTELPRDVLSGTFDMNTMLHQLIDHGVLSTTASNGHHRYPLTLIVVIR